MSNNQQIIESALKNIGFSALNKLQEETILKSEKNKDLLILSQTGSGKTVAFLLPILFNLKSNFPFIQAIIVAPSRELALQIENVFRALKTNHKVLTCYGGHSMQVERNSLTEAPSVLIGTPGRICDHITRNSIDLSKAEYLVIDEYDKCLEFGFEDQMKFIHDELNRLQHTTLVSATELSEYPAYLQFEKPGIVNFLKESGDPQIQFFKVPGNASTKYTNLLRVLSSFQGEPSIVFCNFREATEEIVKYLDANGYDSIAYHGRMEQEERERA
jgi:superfamily II DNA/RNA helicase